MKKGISFLIIFFITCISIEIISYFNFKKYDLFYQAPPIDEINHNLYKTLDPLLGYATDPYFKLSKSDNESGFFSTEEKTKVSKDGFVLLEGFFKDKSINIAIIGESTSDPYLFSGSWPWQLHLILNEKKISHKIYNGAVSGYTSTQQLIKLIRDVLYLEEINIVIAYNGLTDAHETFDIVKNHVGVHVYQRHIFDRLSGARATGKVPNYFPNLQYFLNKALPNRKNFVQYGIENNDNVKTFVKNTKMMNAICKLNGISFYHFLSPIAHVQNQIIKNDKMKIEYLIDKKKNRFSVINFFEELEFNLKNETYFKSYLNLFSEDEKLFIDVSHLNEAGSRKIAGDVFKTINWKKI